MTLTHIHPKLPMRNKAATRQYYEQLGFEVMSDYDNYLIMELDAIEIHFFEHKTLNPPENDGQVYIRTDNVDAWHQTVIDRGIAIHPNGGLATRPWGQREFSLLDPDHNLLTFGQAVA